MLITLYQVLFWLLEVMAQRLSCGHVWLFLVRRDYSSSPQSRKGCRYVGKEVCTSIGNSIEVTRVFPLFLFPNVPVTYTIYLTYHQQKPLSKQNWEARLPLFYIDHSSHPHTKQNNIKVLCSISTPKSSMSHDREIAFVVTFQKCCCFREICFQGVRYWQPFSHSRHFFKLKFNFLMNTAFA